VTSASEQCPLPARVLGVLKNFRILDANQKLFLAKALLEPMTISHPPFAVDASHQHFENDDGISARSPVVFPQAVRPVLRIRRQSAEAFNQTIAFARVNRCGKATALIIIARQKYLNELHGERLQSWLTPLLSSSPSFRRLR